MRALLVINEHATSTQQSGVGHVVAALSEHMDMDIRRTEFPGQAKDFAIEAANAGMDLVIGMGGDGTANELANGLIEAKSTATALVALPGGNANVFARNLGFSRKLTRATGQVITALEQRHFETLGVGRIETDHVDRVFLFNAGLGPDAAVVAAVAKRRNRVRKASDLQYALLAFHELALHVAFRGLPVTWVQTGQRAAFALVLNLTPWSYVGRHPLAPAPHATAAEALALIAPTRTSPLALFRLLTGIYRGRNLAADPTVIVGHDLPAIDLVTDRPMWLQADGEALGQTTSVRLSHHNAALRVLSAAPR